MLAEIIAKGNDGSGGGAGFVILGLVGLFMYSVFFGGKGKTKK